MSDTIIAHLTVTTEVAIPQEFVDDVVCTAFEGGCAEWIDRINVLDKPADIAYSSDALTRGGSYRIIANGVKLTLTLESFLKGLSLYSIQENKPIHELIEDHDAGDADGIFQYALFGELQYS